MSPAQIVFMKKLDHVYENGHIAFASGDGNVLYPVRNRADIFADVKDATVVFHIGNQYYSALPNQFKFCRRH